MRPGPAFRKSSTGSSVPGHVSIAMFATCGAGSGDRSLSWYDETYIRGNRRCGLYLSNHHSRYAASEGRTVRLRPP